MKLSKANICIFLIYASAGCTTHQFRITSEPLQAEVVAYTREGNEVVIGQTPMELKPEDFEKMPSDVLRIGFNKTGYVKEQVFVDSKWFKKSGYVNIKLTPLANWNEAYQDQTAYKYLNDVASLTAEIQAATVKGDYAKAETLGKSLVTRYPRLSVGWNLLGNVYYLQKRMGDALSSYQKSLNLSPDSQDTKDVVNKLRGIASP